MSMLETGLGIIGWRKRRTSGHGGFKTAWSCLKNVHIPRIHGSSYSIFNVLGSVSIATVRATNKVLEKPTWQVHLIKISLCPHFDFIAFAQACSLLHNIVISLRLPLSLHSHSLSRCNRLLDSYLNSWDFKRIVAQFNMSINSMVLYMLMSCTLFLLLQGSRLTFCTGCTGAPNFFS